MTEKAMRLHPYYPDWYLFNLEYSYYYLGEHEKAVEIGKHHINLVENRGAGDTFWQHPILAQNYLRLGQEKEARFHAQEVVRINPKFSLEYFAETLPYKNKVDKEFLIDALTKAGLK